MNEIIIVMIFRVFCGISIRIGKKYVVCFFVYFFYQESASEGMCYLLIYFVMLSVYVQFCFTFLSCTPGSYVNIMAAGVLAPKSANQQT